MPAEARTCDLDHGPEMGPGSHLDTFELGNDVVTDVWAQGVNVSHDVFKASYGRSGANPLLPSLSAGLVIAPAQRSQLADPRRHSKVSLSAIHAITKVLAGALTAWRDGENVTVVFASSVPLDATEPARTVRSRWIETPSGTDVRTWSGVHSSSLAPWVLGIVETILLDTMPEARKTYQALIDRVHELGITLPTRDADAWARIDRDLRARRRIMRLTDALYHETRHRLTTGSLRVDEDPADPPAGTAVSLDDLGLTAPKPRTRVAGATARRRGRVALTPLARLERLAASGGTALLSGPTGTFKTQTGKQLALAIGARLISLKGAAGLEDRDFWGAVAPTTEGPRWVDGPLARAFRTAQRGRTVLLIDELLRFEPLYANVLVGALDLVSPAELRAMGHSPFAAGPHYCVTLPNSETIPAPKRNLTIVATTNLGDDYAQFSDLDAALMGRFELQIDTRRRTSPSCGASTSASSSTNHSSIACSRSRLGRGRTPARRVGCSSGRRTPASACPSCARRAA